MSKKKCKISDEKFIEIVRNSYSVVECLKAQGLVAAGGNYKAFHNRVKQLELDTSHFTGQGHLKGKTHNWAPEVPLEEAFITGGNLTSHTLNKKIRKYKLKDYECSKCGISDWLGEELCLHLDHINGVNNDNRLENLRFLCPNCHSQTETYCGKNTKSKERCKPEHKKVYKDLCECGRDKLIISGKCSYCSGSFGKLSLRRVERPSKEKLLELLWSQSTSSLARFYGVSDNAIRKWAKCYGISYPPVGYWAKFNAGKLEECEIIKNQMIQ
jgi:hypothetical protein